MQACQLEKQNNENRNMLHCCMQRGKAKAGSEDAFKVRGISNTCSCHLSYPCSLCMELTTAALRLRAESWLCTREHATLRAGGTCAAFPSKTQGG